MQINTLMDTKIKKDNYSLINCKYFVRQNICMFNRFLSIITIKNIQMFYNHEK